MEVKFMILWIVVSVGSALDVLLVQARNSEPAGQTQQLSHRSTVEHEVDLFKEEQTETHVHTHGDDFLEASLTSISSDNPAQYTSEYMRAPPLTTTEATSTVSTLQHEEDDHYTKYINKYEENEVPTTESPLTLAHETELLKASQVPISSSAEVTDSPTSNLVRQETTGEASSSFSTSNLISPTEAPSNSTTSSPEHQGNEDAGRETSTRNYYDDALFTTIVARLTDDLERNKATFTNSCVCGQKFVGNKIVGGVETEVNEYPWQVALKSNTGYLFCGGSLITDKHILTAAHCVAGYEDSIVTVVMREHDLISPNETELVIRESIDIIIHPNHNPDTKLNDIAIIELNETVPISRTLSPVCLPGCPACTHNGVTATVTGWGLTSEGFGSDVLNEVQVTVLSQARCRNLGYKPSAIYPQMICAAEQGKDACQGDSGGPLIFKKQSGLYVQIGVVSWGIGCALPQYPGVYTRVNKYLDWIQSNTQTGVYCIGFSFPFTG